MQISTGEEDDRIGAQNRLTGSGEVRLCHSLTASIDHEKRSLRP